MIGRPADSEASPHFFTYINQVAGDDPVGLVERQLDEAMTLFGGISEERSMHRYAPGKWSLRQALSHITDTERVFAYRMLWIARGIDAPLPGFDQDVAAAGAEADGVAWAAHLEEFRQVRLSTISLYRNLPESGWKRSGVVRELPISVQALGFIIPGHVEHHRKILRERYL